jgi:hypothetical protein
MTSRQHATRAVVVHHRSPGVAVCQHCRHVTRFYRDVGWVDTTPPYYGGCYDMCAASVTGQHDPEAGAPRPMLTAWPRFTSSAAPKRAASR